MNYCPNCGKEISGELNFCPNCGARLKQAETVQDSVKKKIKTFPLIICVAVVMAVIAGVLVFTGKSAKAKLAFSDDPEAIQKASDSVLLLYCYDKNEELYCTGSAFAAFEDGIFATNYHVISDEVCSIVAHTESEMMFEIDSVVAYDEEKDIAILKTNAKTNIAPLPFGDSELLEKGEKVVAIGSPLGFVNTVSTGVFSGYNQLQDMVEIQFSASISSGSSGGALFNDEGEVIGITYASYEDGQNLNVAVPVSYVREVWENKTEPVTPAELYDSHNHIETYTPSTLPEPVEGEEVYIEGRVLCIADECVYLTGKETIVSFPNNVSKGLVLGIMEIKQELCRLYCKTSDVFNAINEGNVIRAKCVIEKEKISGDEYLTYNIETVEILSE